MGKKMLFHVEIYDERHGDEEPNTTAMKQVAKRIVDAGLYPDVYYPNTGTDMSAVMVAPKGLTDAAVQRAYKEWLRYQPGGDL